MHSSRSKGKHSKSGSGSSKDRRGGGSRDSGGGGRSTDNRPPSPGQVLQDAQQLLRNLQAQSRQYRDEYDRNAREASRLQIILGALEGERALLSTSATAAKAAREGRMVDRAELAARQAELEREIYGLEDSVRYYHRASDSMSRLLASVEEEIARMDQDIQNLRSGVPLSQEDEAYF